MCSISKTVFVEGLSEILAKSRDYETLLTAWKSWRDVTGKQIKPLYAEFVKLSNEATRQSGTCKALVSLHMLSSLLCDVLGYSRPALT